MTTSTFIDTIGFDGQFFCGEFMAEIEYETQHGADFEITGLKVAAMKRDKFNLPAQDGPWIPADFMLDLLDRDEMDGLIDGAIDHHYGVTMGDTRLASFQPWQF